MPFEIPTPETPINASVSEGGVPQRAADADPHRRIICIQNADVAGGARLWFNWDVAGTGENDPTTVVDVGVGFFLDPGVSRVMDRRDWPEIVYGLFVVSGAGLDGIAYAITANKNR